MVRIAPGGGRATRRQADSLRTATASRAVPLVVGYGLNLVATPLIASSLGLAQFGLWALTGAVAAYGSLLDLGVSRSVTRFTALHLARGEERRADQVFSTAVCLVIGVGMPLLTLSLVAAAPLRDLVSYPSVGDVQLVLLASLVVLVTGQICTVANGASFGREVQSIPNALTTVAGVANNVASTTVAVLTHDVVAYALTFAAMNTLTMVATLVLLHTKVERIRPCRPSWRVLRELTSFGLQGQSVLLAEVVILQFAKIMLGATHGTQASGAYELGSRLALGFRTLGGLFTGALVAPLTRAFSGDGVPGVLHEVERLVTRIVMLSIVPTLFGAALAPALLGVWLGTQSGLVTIVMVALCSGFATNIVTGVQSAAAEAIGRPGLNTRSAVLTAVVAVVAGVPALLLVGPAALAISIGVAIVVGSAYSVVVIQPALGSTPGRFLKVVAGPVAVGSAAAAAAAVVATTGDTDTRADAGLVLTLGVMVFTGVSVPLAWRLGYLPRGVLSGLRRRRRVEEAANRRPAGAAPESDTRSGDYPR